MVMYQDAKATVIAKRKQQQPLLAPYFLMRVTGLPFSTVQQLQFPRAFSLVDELLQIEDWQNAHEEGLQEALRERLKKIEAKEIQHKGLDLRRALKNQNGQKALALLKTIRPCLPEALSVETGKWCERSIRRAELLAIGETTLQGELRENREMLHRLFRNEDFQHGLLLSSETLYSELQNYLQTPVEKNNNRVRRTEEGLLSYLLRMATKTSPYSTFCGTTLGKWDEQAQPSAWVSMQNWQQSRISRLVSPLFSTITGMLVTCQELRPYLFVSLNNTLRWLAREAPEQNNWGHVEILVQEKVKGRRFDYNERIARFRLNPFTFTLIKILEEAQETWTYQQLQVIGITHMKHLLISNDQHEQGEEKPVQMQARIEQQIARSLDQLITHNMLQLDLRIPTHEDDKLLCLLERLTAIPGEWIAEIRRDLEKLHRLITSYGTVASAEAAHSILGEIRQQVITLCRAIGARQDPPQDPTEQINKLYQMFIVEDLVFPQAQPVLTRQTWEPVLADLQILHDLAPLLDFGIVAKMHMDRWAREALPEPEDFVACHLRFWQDFLSRRSSYGEQERVDPQFVQLRGLQRAFVQRIEDQIHQAQQEQSNLVRLDLKELQHFTRTFPPFLKRPASLAHFGQFFIEDGEPRMVLNGTWTGPGAAFSRFTHPFTAATRDNLSAWGSAFSEQMRAYTAELGQRQQTIYASLAETGDINVNSHGRLTPYEILFPASCSQYDRDQQLSLRDLQASFDNTAQELRVFSQRLNRWITPLHLGFSLVRMMPPLYQALVTTTEHYPKFDLLTLLEAQLTAEEKKRVRYYPRVVLGHIVLNRACWKVPLATIPVREPGETTFDYCVKINRWRTVEGLPITCFRRVILDTETPLAAQLSEEATQPATETVVEVSAAESQSEKRKGATGQIEKGLRKPFYLDFRNSFLISMFHTALKAFPPGTTITFEEVLPAPEHHLLTREGQNYATECIFELSCQPGKEAQ
ncbi:MAG TPA: lantibiotic dehydratase [Ktedonobacteraceae bacterium]|nr:lantibiotic dehydratase [Ktedonobacteraceae bacterium]